MHLKTLIVAGVATVAIGAAAATRTPRPASTTSVATSQAESEASLARSAHSVSVGARIPQAPTRAAVSTPESTLAPVTKVAGESTQAAYLRTVSVERYQAFVRKAALTPAQVDALNAVLADVAADLETLHQDLEKARTEADPDGWLAYQNNAWDAVQDDIFERVSKILTPEQLVAVGGEIGVMQAFPASTLAGVRGGLVAPRR